MLEFRPPCVNVSAGVLAFGLVVTWIFYRIPRWEICCLAWTQEGLGMLVVLRIHGSHFTFLILEDWGIFVLFFAAMLNKRQ